MPTDLPRLRPRQWELLERFVAIEERMESQHAVEPILVAFPNTGAKTISRASRIS